MVELFAFRIEQRISGVDVTPLIQQVSATRQEKIKRYRFKDDVFRSLFSKMLIRRVLREKYNINNKDIVFSFNDYRKLTIVEPIQQQYNVSHSGSWIACAISCEERKVDKAGCISFMGKNTRLAFS